MSRAINSELGSIIDARCIELRGRVQQAGTRSSENAALLRAAEEQIGKCLDTLKRFRFFSGSLIPIAQSYFDAAFTIYLRTTPDDIASVIPTILGMVQEILPPGDAHRAVVETISRRVSKKIKRAEGEGVEKSGRSGGTGDANSSEGEGGDNRHLNHDERETLLGALEAAQQVRAQNTLRVRSFVRIVVAVGLFLAIAATFVALMGAVYPQNVPLCFVTQVVDPAFRTVCPVNSAAGGAPDAPNPQAMTAADYIVVEVIGLVAAGLAAATAIRRVRGTTTPYNVALALGFLKLPTGALTAPLGILLMRGGFVPGLSALASSAQIIAWAIIFGYSQQLLTFMVDRQAQAIVGNTRSDQEGEPVRILDSATPKA